MPLFLRSFTGEIDGWVANGVRYPFAALLWALPLLYFMRKGKVNAQIWKLALIPSLVNAIAQMFWAWSPYFLEPGMLMFLGRSSIIFSILASFIIFPDERTLIRSRLFWLGLFACVVGFVGLNVLRGNLSSNVTLVGVTVILCHGIFVGFYGVSVRYFMRGTEAWVAFSVICMYTALAMFVVMLFLGDMPRLLDMTSGRLYVLAISAVIGIAASHVAFYYAIEHLGVAISVSCGLIMPFLTAIGSYFIFGETFTLGQIGAGIVLLCGTGLLIRAQLNLGETHHAAPTSDIAEIEIVSSVDEPASVEDQEIWHNQKGSSQPQEEPTITS